ncbi:hypothetical protein ACIPJN_30000 [Streptomyces sp. NPDC086796]|uniref:hypothetical protein n=1 Tax=Streptomyces sp. NPDC086796 TaxID=3365760 RepID=UPI00381F2D93
MSTANTSIPPDLVVSAAHIAGQAAKQAVFAADTAMHAAARSTAASSRLDSVMFAAHKAATEAEHFARLAAEEEQAGNQATSRNLAARAIGYAVSAQQAAGVPCTAQKLAVLVERRRTEAELQEAARAEQERAAAYEAELRASTGMDAENRLLLEIAKYEARDEVPGLGWGRGMVRAMEFALAGRLYRRDGFAWASGSAGLFTGGRRVARERVLMLARAGFLAVGRGSDRSITITAMGEVALYLARLHPEGIHADDRTAHSARLLANRRRGRRSDDVKAAAMTLPPLDRYFLRSFKRPVTLAEQAARAALEAEQTWESEGGALTRGPCTPRLPLRVRPLQLSLPLGNHPSAAPAMSASPRAP